MANAPTRWATKGAGPVGAATGTTIAVTFVWLGMVLAISFLEAPLKFRAPGLTVPVGLAVGRLVFRALHVVEGLLAVLVIAGLSLAPPATATTVALGLAITVLVTQVVLVQPWLGRRSDRVLSGEDSGEGSRSRAHLVFVVAEVVKVVALAWGGVGLLAAG